MLSEIRDVRQIANEKQRRSFSDDFMDLTVWFSEDGGIAGFELCYDKGRNERALRWLEARGFEHQRVDDGEESPWENMTPILVPDGTFSSQTIARLFHERSRAIDPVIADFVHRTLLRYPG